LFVSGYAAMKEDNEDIRSENLATRRMEMMVGKNDCSFGLIGCGYWGPNIIRNLYDLGVSVPMAADLSPDRRHWIESRYPATTAVSDWGEVLKDERVEAVAIATPPQTHHEIAKAALENGKHVLVEKPMALTTADCDDLIAVAKHNDRLLMVDHVYVYTSAIRKIKELIEQGELGQPYYYDSVRVNLGLFQTHANVLWDLAPHDLSIVDYLFSGMDIGSIQAMGNSLSELKQEYQVHASLKMTDGLLAHIHVNWLSPVKVRQIIVAGDKRMVVFDETNPAEPVKVYDKGFMPSSDEERHKALGAYRTGDMYSPQLDGGEAIRRMLQQFLHCAATGESPDASGEQGRRVVNAMERIQAAIAENALSC